jgi:integrase
LLKRGLARSTVTRALATLRSLLSFAVADGRVTVNVAAGAKALAGGQARREGKYLDLDEVAALAAACRGRYGELVYVLAFHGLRWGELAGLQVADRVMVPGRGLRLSRAVLASNGGGTLYIDTLKNKRARTVPLVPVVVPIVDRWSIGKGPSDWLFAAPEGGPLRETNWKRSVGWYQAKTAIGRPELRVHDLRHTAASAWLGAGADPKVVQRVLGHASAAMTMDLYGHLIDRNLWDAAGRFGRPVRGHHGGICGPGAGRRTGHSWAKWCLSRANGWSRLGESNPRPTHYECVALPAELRRPVPGWHGRQLYRVAYDRTKCQLKH